MSLHATVVAGWLLVRGWLAGSNGRHLGHTSWRRAVLVVLAQTADAVFMREMNASLVGEIVGDE